AFAERSVSIRSADRSSGLLHLRRSPAAGRPADSGPMVQYVQGHLGAASSRHAADGQAAKPQPAPEYRAAIQQRVDPHVSILRAAALPAQSIGVQYCQYSDFRSSQQQSRLTVVRQDPDYANQSAAIDGVGIPVLLLTSRLLPSARSVFAAEVRSLREGPAASHAACGSGGDEQALPTGVEPEPIWSSGLAPRKSTPYFRLA